MAVRIGLFLLALGYALIPAWFGMLDPLARSEADTAAGRPEALKHSCLVPGINLGCSSSFYLDIARRRFRADSVLGAQEPLRRAIATGGPVRVLYDARACRGYTCSVLGIELLQTPEQDGGATTATRNDMLPARDVLVPFRMLSTFEAGAIVLCLLGSAICLAGAVGRRPGVIS